jgi:hypothetical protein
VKIYLKPCEENFRVLLIQLSKNLCKFWNYYSLDNYDLYNIVSKVRQVENIGGIFVIKVGYVIFRQTKSLCQVQ